MKFSSLARPPIQPEEAEAAEHSICPYHGASGAPGWFTEGRVFYCPIGRMAWRYSSNAGNGMYAPLDYPSFGGV